MRNEFSFGELVPKRNGFDFKKQALKKNEISFGEKDHARNVSIEEKKDWKSIF